MLSFPAAGRVIPITPDSNLPQIAFIIAAKAREPRAGAAARHAEAETTARHAEAEATARHAEAEATAGAQARHVQYSQYLQELGRQGLPPPIARPACISSGSRVLVQMWRVSPVLVQRWQARA